jgi:cytochrome c biogenesis protein CcmG/thiol:disulfide interchange protein DsbE
VRSFRWLVVPALVLPIAWLLLQGIGRDPRALASPLVGQPMPAFELVGIDGQRVVSEDLRGRVVIVNFWASWCFECIAEHQVLLEAQHRYGADLAIVGVLYQDRPQDALAFLARHGDGRWPNLVDEEGRVAIDYGVTGVPESFFLDRSGVVRYKQFGAVTAAVVDAELPGLVSQAPSPTR